LLVAAPGATDWDVTQSLVGRLLAYDVTGLSFSVGIDMGESKNILNTTLKKMDRLEKMNVFRVLIIVMMLVCVSLDVSYQELGRLIFLEGVFGLTHISSCPSSERTLLCRELTFCC